MTARCRTCGRFVGACRECGARYCQRCQPMQHEHGWEPERRQKQGRRHSLRRLLAGRLRPLWLPHRPIRSQRRAPAGEVRGVRMGAADAPRGRWLRPDGLAHRQPCAAMAAGCVTTFASRAILDDSWHASVVRAWHSAARTRWRVPGHARSPSPCSCAGSRVCRRSLRSPGWRTR
jgi:hypothetical protein